MNNQSPSGDSELNPKLIGGTRRRRKITHHPKTMAVDSMPPVIYAQLNYLLTHSPYSIKVEQMWSGSKNPGFLDRFTLTIPFCLDYIKCGFINEPKDDKIPIFQQAIFNDVSPSIGKAVIITIFSDLQSPRIPSIKALEADAYQVWGGTVKQDLAEGREPATGRSKISKAPTVRDLPSADVAEFLLPDLHTRISVFCRLIRLQYQEQILTRF
ncbi:hypothetical protein LXL04_029118 [Taraxacum kok-saghyz]